MSTPQRTTKQRSVYSEGDKKSLLDNFDLEGASHNVTSGSAPLSTALDLRANS